MYIVAHHIRLNRLNKGEFGPSLRLRPVVLGLTGVSRCLSVIPVLGAHRGLRLDETRQDPRAHLLMIPPVYGTKINVADEKEKLERHLESSLRQDLGRTVKTRRASRPSQCI